MLVKRPPKYELSEKFYARESLEKVTSLAMEVCSIQSMVFIIGVRAYNRLSISQISIQTQQYARVRHRTLSRAAYFSLNIKQNSAFYGENRYMPFLDPYMEFKLRNIGIQ